MIKFLHLLILGGVLPLASIFAQATNDDLVSVQFPNAPVLDILHEYEILTGKTLVRDANLAGPSLTVVTNQKLPKAEAIRFIESALLLNGYSLIPGPDNTVKVINTNNGGGKLPRNEGVPLYSNIDDLPKGDEVVSFFLPLRYISAADATPIFQQQIQGHNYGIVIPVPTAQAVVITDNSAAIRQLIGIREMIDVPPAQVISEFVQLHRADAEKVSDTLNKLIDTKNSQSSDSAPANLPGGAQYESKLVAGQVEIFPDARTNRILVVTRPANFAYLKGLIEQFDQAADVMAPYYRPLKYIKADDVLPVLQSLLAESKDDLSSSSTPSTSQPTSANKSSSNTASNTGGDNGNSSINETQPLQSELESQPDEPPQAVIVGKTRLIADNKTNAILIFGPPDSIAKAGMILDSLDIRAKQVYLATVIGKLSLTNDSTLSVNLLQNYAQTHGANGIASSSQGNGATAAFSDPRSLLNPTTFPIIGGLSLYGAVGHTLNYYVQALESTGKFSVLSRPSVFTANNKTASISSGSEVPVPETSLSNLDTSTTNNVSQESTIAYKDIELLLEVKPLINSEKDVTLDISTQNNTISGETTISGNSVPTISSDKLETTVTVPNKQTVILGGLIRDSDQSNRDGVPVLENIPYLGALFRTDTKTRERDELVILIEPTVIETDSDLAEARVAEMSRAKVIGADSVKYETNPIPVVNGKSTAVESLSH